MTPPECGCRVNINFDTIAEWNIDYCPKHASVDRLMEAAKRVPEPDDEGYCEGCGKRPGLERFYVNGNPYDRLKHGEDCWFGKLRNALTQAEGKGEVGNG